MKKKLLCGLALLTFAGVAAAACPTALPKDVTCFEYKQVPQDRTPPTKASEILYFYLEKCMHCQMANMPLSRWLKTLPATVDFQRLNGETETRRVQVYDLDQAPVMVVNRRYRFLIATEDRQAMLDTFAIAEKLATTTSIPAMR